MNKYQVDQPHIYENTTTNVKVFKGTCISTGERIVIKQFNCKKSDFQQSVRLMNTHINEGLGQARVSSEHSCEIREIVLDCSIVLDVWRVCLILEDLDSDLQRIIDQKKNTGSQFTEADIRKCLWQVGQAVCHAHSKVTFK